MIMMYSLRSLFLHINFFPPLSSSTHYFHFIYCFIFLRVKFRETLLATKQQLVSHAAEQVKEEEREKERRLESIRAQVGQLHGMIDIDNSICMRLIVYVSVAAKNHIIIVASLNSCFLYNCIIILEISSGFSCFIIRSKFLNTSV